MERQIGILGWRLQLPKTMVGWVDQVAGGAKASGRDVGLWQLKLGGMMVTCGDVVRG